MTKSRREEFENQRHMALKNIPKIRETLKQFFSNKNFVAAEARMKELKAIVKEKLAELKWDENPIQTNYEHRYHRACLLLRLAREPREQAFAREYIKKQDEAFLLSHRKRRIHPEDIPDPKKFHRASDAFVRSFILPQSPELLEQEFLRLSMMKGTIFDQTDHLDFAFYIDKLREEVRQNFWPLYSYLIDDAVEDYLDYLRLMLRRQDAITREQFPENSREVYDLLMLEAEASQKLEAYDYLCDNGFPEQLADLPEFLDIEAEIDTGISQPENYIFRTSGPANLDKWQKHQRQIEFFLENRVHIEMSDANRITLIPQIALPDIIPFTKQHLAQSQVCFGHDTRTGQPYFIPLADMTHILVVGISGTGKSVFLNQLMQGFLYNIDQIKIMFLVDLKGGVELFPYDKISDRVHVIYRMEDLYEVVSTLLRVMYRRFDWMRENSYRKWPGEQIFFIVDEYAQIHLYDPADKDEKNLHRGLLVGLKKLSSMGRGVGIRLIAQLQKATTDVMDSSFKENLQSRICFRVSTNLSVANVFASSKELPADALMLKKGQFIFYDDSKAQTVVLQSCIVPDNFDNP